MAKRNPDASAAAALRDGKRPKTSPAAASSASAIQSVLDDIVGMGAPTPPADVGDDTLEANPKEMMEMAHKMMDLAWAQMQESQASRADVANLSNPIRSMADKLSNNAAVFAAPASSSQAAPVQKVSIERGPKPRQLHPELVSQLSPLGKRSRSPLLDLPSP